MSVKSTESVAANQYKITFDVDHATFEAAINKVYKKSVKNIIIPGFRKGKAPRAIVEKMYGKEVFYEDAINEVIPAAYTDAVKDFEKTIVSQPEFDVESIDENGVVLTAVFFTKPEAEIADYLGLPVTREVKEATEEEINEELSRTQARNSRMIEITDRAAAMDDIANIDFEGFVDGTAFAGGKAEGHELKLGSNQFIPGFEDQIVGHNIGDAFDVTVTFPEDYHAEELKGKEAVFKCKLNGLKFNELPVLDDDFAKDVSEFDTLDEYKADIKAKINERHAKAADASVEEQIIKALGEKLVCDIPECMYENETENFVRDYDNRLRMQGLDLATYFKYTGMDLDTLRKNMRPDAERQVKTRLALEKIAALENIVPSEEEVEEEYKRLAEAYNMEVEKVKEAVAADAIAEDLKVKKAVDLVKEKAVVTEAAPEVSE
ncbi:MAG: trigger factor [Ruminococcaceae bacterium]|nr:trigger factor [Oscillospiraceae bacterium]